MGHNIVFNKKTINEFGITKLKRFVNTPKYNTYFIFCFLLAWIFKTVVKNNMDINASKKPSGIDNIFVKVSFGVVSAVQIVWNISMA